MRRFVDSKRPAGRKDRNRTAPDQSPRHRTNPSRAISRWTRISGRQTESRSTRRASSTRSTLRSAILRIPKIDLEVAVLDGTSELVLNRGVGHITGTPLPGEAGNIGIAGHRDGYFRGLKDVVEGDLIEMETLAGDSKATPSPSSCSSILPMSGSSIPPKLRPSPW